MDTNEIHLLNKAIKSSSVCEDDHDHNQKPPDIIFTKFEKHLGHRFIHQGLLGEGTYGCVFKVVDKKTPLPFKFMALKVQDHNDTEWVYYLREVEALLELQEHPNIVEIKEFGYSRKDGSYRWILMEYLPNDGVTIMQKWSYKKRLMSIPFIAFHILSALDYMHKKNIVHRDIKPANILIDYHDSISNNSNSANNEHSQFDIRLCDFGISKSITLPELTGLVCTLNYRPPELLTPSLMYHKYNSKIDIWSLGVTLLNILLGSNCFYCNTIDEMIKILASVFGSSFFQKQIMEESPIGLEGYIESHGIIISNEIESLDRTVYDLLVKMLVIDPTQRCNAEELLKHRLFTSFKEIDMSTRHRQLYTAHYNKNVQNEKFDERRFRYFTLNEYFKILKWTTRILKQFKAAKMSLLNCLQIIDWWICSLNQKPSKKVLYLNVCACIQLATSYNQICGIIYADIQSETSSIFTETELSCTIGDLLTKLDFRLSKFYKELDSKSCPLAHGSYKEILRWFLQHKNITDNYKMANEQSSIFSFCCCSEPRII